MSILIQLLYKSHSLFWCADWICRIVHVSTSWQRFLSNKREDIIRRYLPFLQNHDTQRKDGVKILIPFLVSFFFSLPHESEDRVTL